MKCYKTGDANTATRRSGFILSRVIPAGLLALSGFASTAPVTAAELVVNGGFENPDLMTFPAGSRAFEKGWTTFFGQNYTGTPPCTVNCANGLYPGWDVYWTDTLLDPVPEAGRIEIQNDFLPDWANPILIGDGKEPIFYAHSGTQKAELDTHDRRDPVTNAVIDNSNISLGQVLQTCPGTPYKLSYAWRSRLALPGDNDVRVVVGDAVPRVHSLNDNWAVETINFVASALQTNLAFVSIGTGETHGMSLDSISVTGQVGGTTALCDVQESCKFKDYNADGVHDDLDHHLAGGDPTCNCENESGDICPVPHQKGDKLDTLTLLYNGTDFSDHDQPADKVFISPVVVPATDFPPTAKIIASDGDGPLGTFLVAQGGLFTIDIRKASTVFEIRNPNTNALIQSVEFHTSCSKPLAKFDEFGGITAWDGVLLP